MASSSVRLGRSKPDAIAPEGGEQERIGRREPSHHAGAFAWGEGSRIGRMGGAAALSSDAFHPCYIRYFRYSAPICSGSSERSNVAASVPRQPHTAKSQPNSSTLRFLAVAKAQPESPF